MQDYRRLRVWRKAIDLAARTYDVTIGFPSSERFGLTSQMRRAAVSISSNIAEGCGRSSRPDVARFLEMATGSAHELESQIEVAHRLGYLASRGGIAAEVGEIIRMLASLTTSVRSAENHRIRW